MSLFNFYRVHFKFVAEDDVFSQCIKSNIDRRQKWTFWAKKEDQTAPPNLKTTSRIA